MRSPRLRDRKGGTTEEQKWELYIPSGVKAENELFNGLDGGSFCRVLQAPSLAVQ